MFADLKDHLPIGCLHRETHSHSMVFEKIRPLVSSTMPFANLPDTHKSRWGDELTAEKMKECAPKLLHRLNF
jgi:hypothetical protein